MRRTQRTVDNDLRLLANYSQRLGKVAARMTVDEIWEMSPEDLSFLVGWADRLATDLTNLVESARATALYRDQAHI